MGCRAVVLEGEHVASIWNHACCVWATSACACVGWAWSQDVCVFLHISPPGTGCLNKHLHVMLGCADVWIHRCCFVHIYILPSMQIHLGMQCVKMSCKTGIRFRVVYQSPSAFQGSVEKRPNLKQVQINRAALKPLNKKQMSMTSSLCASWTPFGLVFANTGSARQGLHALCMCTDWKSVYCTQLVMQSANYLLCKDLSASISNSLVKSPPFS